MSTTTGKPAEVEDWDSDKGCANPATLKQASKTTPRRPEQQTSRTKQGERASRRDAASDSGYSSHTSAAQGNGALPPLATKPNANPTALTSPIKSNSKKPLTRQDSARSASRSQTISHPASKQIEKCADSNCRDPNCQSSRNKERRYTVNLSQPLPPKQTQPPQYSYAPAPQYQYSTEMPPPPRPRTVSTSRPARPQSFHAGMPMSYGGVKPGPPPSASAYYGYAQGFSQQPPIYGSTPPTQNAIFPPPSPIAAIPTSPTSPSMSTYPGFPGYTGTISARHVNHNVPGLETSRPMAPPGVATRAIQSARRPDDRAVPGSFPADYEEYTDDTSSESESSGAEYSDEEYDRSRRHRPRVTYATARSKSRRRSRSRGPETAVAVSNRRRPSMHKTYRTESSVPTRSASHRNSLSGRSQDLPLRRAPHSATGLEYTSSDNFDSDRTTRPVVNRSYQSSAKSSRRPSVSTQASSRSTKATTLSSVTDYSRAVIEDSRGRRVVYLSQEQQAELIKQHERQKLRDTLDEQQRLADRQAAAASAYQKDISGGVDAYELTAENLKHQYRKSASHVSGRSQKSAGSGSKASQRADGVKIHAGGTVLHVYGDMALQVRTGDDGETHFVVGSQTGKESDYHPSSKSSGSRVGRSRVPRRRDATREDEYEPGL